MGYPYSQQIFIDIPYLMVSQLALLTVSQPSDSSRKQSNGGFVDSFKHRKPIPPTHAINHKNHPHGRFTIGFSMVLGISPSPRGSVVQFSPRQRYEGYIDMRVPYRYFQSCSATLIYFDRRISIVRNFDLYLSSKFQWAASMAIAAMGTAEFKENLRSRGFKKPPCEG